MEAIWVAAALRADSTHTQTDHAFEELSAEDRATMAPDTSDAFRTFTERIFDDGALSERTKRLLAVTVAHALQCESCIADRADHARDAGATDAELMEAVWVAVEMQAGGAYAHAAIALDEMEDTDD
ncbi:carboxymuconolactone decarboxylase family protein [Halosimplex aquaticum]|nr:carboxymuconolactone decarboxylase family protein [Halosimplex aquaticum]